MRFFIGGIVGIVAALLFGFKGIICVVLGAVGFFVFQTLQSGSASRQQANIETLRTIEYFLGFYERTLGLGHAAARSVLVQEFGARFTASTSLFDKQGTYGEWHLPSAEPLHVTLGEDAEPVVSRGSIMGVMGLEGIFLLVDLDLKTGRKTRTLSATQALSSNAQFLYDALRANPAISEMSADGQAWMRKASENFW